MTSIKSMLSKYTLLDILHAEEINVGFSKDKKYKLADIRGAYYFMRQSEKANPKDKLKHEYEILKMLMEKNYPAPKPLFYFLHARKSYLITTFIEGENLSDVIGLLSSENQYLIGKHAGELLKSLHNQFKMELPLDAFIQRKMSEYLLPFNHQTCEDVYNVLYTYVSENLHLIPSKSSVLEHSDFHLGNLFIHENQLYLIDFNGSHVGIIHDEFYKLELFDYEISPHYVNGVFDSYLSSIEKASFFRLHKVFLAISLIQALRWGSSQNNEIYQKEIERTKRIIASYDRYQSVFPNWMIEQKSF